MTCRDLCGRVPPGFCDESVERVGLYENGGLVTLTWGIE